jgi:hypothetical protein
MNVPKGFIALEIIRSNPARDKSTIYITAESVMTFGPAQDEYITIGASSYIELKNGNQMISTESVEEISARLSTAMLS